ncbi:hypothetical protein B0A52_06944 [Exophiala mesophila]|uniref:DNA mismatch repair protein HSM3 N-terminal domain-containing protein n=1 Tax=Exophiala mesophila TaxID=212818 RepID=A0A438N0U1_EXOME|nr:hypothetical protein B0A52_06944 [Exophiala mesophila]
MDAVIENQDVLFPQVFSHLESVESSATPLDEELLRRAARSLDSSSPKLILWRLLDTGERILQTIQQDPQPLTRLLERVISLIPFDELKQSISTDKLEQGLQSLSSSIQLLCLAYISKAADTPSGASFVASTSTLMQTLLNTWLSTENTEIADRALQVIEALLLVDNTNNVTVVVSGEQVGEAQGQGLIWRRIFHDPAVYAILFEWTSLVRSKRDIKTKKGLQLVTISQARLFDFVARSAQLDWSAITTSSLPSIESQYIQEDGSDRPYGGLLRYAASHMIDRGDILMEVLRQEFFIKLLEVIEEKNPSSVSPRLLEAIQQGAGMESTKKESEDVGMHL